MKAIELDNIQKDKLLEMCRYLFPEYKFEFLRGEDQYGYTLWDMFTFCLQKDYEACEYEKSRTEIHWFEFCIVELSRSLIGYSLRNKKDFPKLSKLYQGVLDGSEHPVDYLYKEFLKFNDGSQIK